MYFLKKVASFILFSSLKINAKRRNCLCLEITGNLDSLYFNNIDNKFYGYLLFRRAREIVSFFFHHSLSAFLPFSFLSCLFITETGICATQSVSMEYLYVTECYIYENILHLNCK